MNIPSRNTFKKAAVGLLGLALAVPSLVAADPVVYADLVPKKDFQERVEVPVAQDMGCGFNARLSAGSPVFFFEKQDTRAAGGVYMDMWHCDTPLNFRVGAEVNHMFLKEDSSRSFAEFDDKGAKITFVRIPFALEYMMAMDDDSTLFLGGGPDILHTANDNSDTNVGLHLSARYHYAFTENFGAALEAGYLWGSVDSTGGDVTFDGAFVTPQLSYTF